MKPEKTGTPFSALAEKTPQRPVFPKSKKWIGIGVLVFFLLAAAVLGKIYFFPSQDEQEGSLSPFARAKQQTFAAKEPKSALLDLAAVNASLRARGQRTDNLAGAYVGSEDEQPPAYTGPVNGWSRAASAAVTRAQKAQDVYFGEDGDAALRSAAAQGVTRGSSDTVSLHAQTAVAGAATVRPETLLSAQATGIDSAALERALRRYAPNANLTEDMPVSAAQTQLNDIADSSFSAQNAGDLMRKKQLASASFMGANVAQEREVVGLGDATVLLRGTETGNSYQEANKQLSAKQKCPQLTAQAKENIAAQLPQVRDLIRALRAQVPDGCQGVAEWKNKLLQVRSHCQKIKAQLVGLKNTCGLILTKEGTCEAVYLEAHAADLSEVCEKIAAAQTAAARNENTLYQLKVQLDELTHNFDVGQLNNTFNLNVDGIVGRNDFFPETENAGLQQS